MADPVARWRQRVRHPQQADQHVPQLRDPLIRRPPVPTGQDRQDERRAEVTDEQAAAAIIHALHVALGRNVPVRDHVLSGLTPALREEYWAILGDHRERIATT